MRPPHLHDRNPMVCTKCLMSSQIHESKPEIEGAYGEMRKFVFIRHICLRGGAGTMLAGKEFLASSLVTLI